MKIAGLDIGTTGCKLTVFDESGNQIDKAYRDYPVCRSAGTHEIDLSALLESVYAVLHELGPKYPDLKGIGVTSFGETCVLVDGAGTPLHNAMLYTDPRGAEECAELVHKLGAARIASITGLAPHEMYSISKLMWLKKHRPEVWDAARHIHLIEDLVVRHLTGRAQIDYSLASRTMAFDIHTLTWSKEVLDAALLNTYCMAQPRMYLSPFECINPPFERGAFMSFNSPITSLDKWSIPTVTTTKLTNGAIAMFYTGVKEKIAELYGDSYYVVFTSIHEARTHCRGVYPPRDILRSLKETNRVFPKEEMLSNKVYYYDRERGTFEALML